MKTPTEQEIQAAYEAMLPDLADEEFSARMGRLAAEDPMLQYQIKVLADAAGAAQQHPEWGNPGDESFLRIMMAGALMYGMHIGIYIGIARRSRQ